MTTKLLPSAEYLRECFSYDLKTGELRWRETWQNRRYAGKLAGHVRPDGYRHVRVAGSLYEAHRIIWKLVTGKEPSTPLDHWDVDPNNNKWVNLRPATPTQSNFNQRLRRDNTSGTRGVHPKGKRWWARITTHGVIRHLGSFDTFEEARALREQVARELHGEFYRASIKDDGAES